MRALLVVLCLFYWMIAGILLVSFLLDAIYPSQVTVISARSYFREPSWAAKLLGRATILACAVAPVAMVVLNRYRLTVLARATMFVPVALYSLVAAVSTAHAMALANWVLAFFAVFVFSWISVGI